MWEKRRRRRGGKCVKTLEVKPRKKEREREREREGGREKKKYTVPPEAVDAVLVDILVI